uniref:Uncharacterized protein n=1 Tax=Cacopsylla melanoneura TaxID=428564 RepID=A0A8D8S917_9HEMI
MRRCFAPCSATVPCTVPVVVGSLRFAWNSFSFYKNSNRRSPSRRFSLLSPSLRHCLYCLHQWRVTRQLLPTPCDTYSVSRTTCSRLSLRCGPLPTSPGST